MITYDNFKDSIQKEIDKFNAEKHLVCGGTTVITYKMKTSTNEIGEHFAQLYFKWDNEEKYHKSEYLIRYSYYNFSDDKICLFQHNSCIQIAKRMSRIFNKIREHCMNK